MKQFAVERHRAPGLALSRIRIPKTSEIVADQFRAQIVLGELGEGESLPSESHLMEALGVSRATLREAFRILEAENLISVGRGSRTGAKVHRPSTELVSRYAGYVLQSQGTTVSDLYEGRMAIEPLVVRRLAMSQSETAIAALRREVKNLDDLLELSRFDEFIEAVSSFHEALVEAGGVRTLSFMNKMLLDLIRNHQIDYLRRHKIEHPEQAKRLRVAVKSYTKLIDLIEAGTAKEAVQHWRLHLDKAHATWAINGEGGRTVNSLMPQRLLERSP